ncbi:hypothetical protein DMJ13_06320 [halophilic archaeon]|nr:hypothetical protein DMJ13_06320 [halophilic archaeon]
MSDGGPTEDPADAEDDAPLSRVRRAKTERATRPPTHGLDAGAVAVGLVPALGAKLAAALLSLLSLPGLTDVAALASTLAAPLGGYVAGRYAGTGDAAPTGGDRRRGALHGALAVAGTLVLTGVGAVAVATRPLTAVRAILVADAGGPGLLAAASVALVTAGGVAGALARRP